MIQENGQFMMDGMVVPTSKSGPHAWLKSKAVGDKGEGLQDRFYGQQYTIEPATLSEDRDRGIDRLFTHKEFKFGRISVQYKIDWESLKTGNLFIETMSNDNRRSESCIFATKAHFISICVPNSLPTFYWCVANDLRNAIYGWVMKGYHIGKSPNRGYNTLGLCVPLDDIRKAHFIQRFESKTNLFKG